jgi:predicted nucleic acid-binding protein
MHVDTLMDAGPLVGFLDRGDQWHKFSAEVFKRLTFPAYTCEAVLSEAAYHLRTRTEGRDALLSLVDSGALIVLPVFPEGRAYVRTFLARYGSRADLGDACLMYLAERAEGARIVTTDRRDFARYRFARRKGVPDLAIP